MLKLNLGTPHILFGRLPRLVSEHAFSKHHRSLSTHQPRHPLPTAQTHHNVAPPPWSCECSRYIHIVESLHNTSTRLLVRSPTIRHYLPTTLLHSLAHGHRLDLWLHILDCKPIRSSAAIHPSIAALLHHNILHTPMAPQPQSPPRHANSRWHARVL